MQKKILVAIDDSENSMRAVEFVGLFFTKDSEITLFNVISNTAALCDMNSPELTPYFISQQKAFCVLEDKKQELANKALQKGKDILTEAGFNENSITVKAEMNKTDIARDIIKESQAGYDAIVIGKRGVSGIKDFLLGGIAQKVFSLAKDISVIFVN